MWDRTRELLVTAQLLALIHPINLCLPGFEPATFQLVAVMSDLTDYCTHVQLPLQLNSEYIGINLLHKKIVSKIDYFIGNKNHHNFKDLQCKRVCVCMCVRMLGDYSTELSIMHQQKIVSSSKCRMWIFTLA